MENKIPEKMLGMKLPGGAKVQAVEVDVPHPGPGQVQLPAQVRRKHLLSPVLQQKGQGQGLPLEQIGQGAEGLQIINAPQRRNQLMAQGVGGHARSLLSE